MVKSNKGVICIKPSKKLKKVKRLKTILLFPHLITCYIIIILAISSILLSFYFNVHSDNFLSSIFSNIFAGLVTGLIICLVGSIKQIYKNKLKSQKEWLKRLAEMYQDYDGLYYNLLQAPVAYINDSDDIYDLVYDVGTKANDINSFILQSPYNNSILFNPRKYSIKALNYNAYAMIDCFEELHQNMIKLDIIGSDKKETIDCFRDINRILKDLNHKVYLCIRETEIQLSGLEKTLI